MDREGNHVFDVEQPHGDKTLSDVCRMVVYLQKGVSPLMRERSCSCLKEIKVILSYLSGTTKLRKPTAASLLLVCVSLLVFPTLSPFHPMETGEIEYFGYSKGISMFLHLKA